ncbi:deoxyribodipyrimidine photo-lyase [Psychroserpens sp.]|uniref:cryptochrome/photolyase family protein n=1 Tax=Psychroserpens sp. TaxID=2020870 RepID=UPI001B057F8A|nr:deoxyribodipyrimidine photo-lyase [Psychroserpens sp.]MBO6607557.1 deoxyribodipyrimidine photo-lyase [Psychroserpens sp.]MBO6631662.1 deoxyribodipyrimidine photo-lyase [Psychroserpens sp.]MBO6655217.1 deoxyribodipyrimidine photo-lyase [Psychroserpens sp.]MBO6683193.1 deoxyribodipyrimidine photo-lyase [Psychroserpens sp.]MBO6749757.1 deoxyribodipyrimidine photo-lyase [Psychroserpens sp.]
MKQPIAVFWFRRDLRLDDNVGLFHALNSSIPVLPIFIFDTEILNKLPKRDARVNFIHDILQEMQNLLKSEYNRSLAIYSGQPIEIFEQLLSEYNIQSVYTNRDYEPYADERDSAIENLLSAHNCEFKTYKDQVIFEQNEVVKKDGNPYVVYTPYMRSWKAKFQDSDITYFDSKALLQNCIEDNDLVNLSLSDIGFEHSDQKIAHYSVTPQLIQEYEATRNFPALDATSKLGPHLRFGTVSIRQMVKKAIAEENEIFWQELIWREFFMQILWHFPYTKDRSFKAKYDRIEWRNNEEDFKKWCDGNTGYPLVDAGMRELNETGFMHNRVRMLVGSFLCKHLLIDWRWGEAYFAEKLHDYEMASNVGNWQWVAGSGVDAAPYFRIFNPTSQIQKFDKNHDYIKKWVPEYQELTYPQPMVDHKFARERCLTTYKAAVS